MRNKFVVRNMEELLLLKLDGSDELMSFKVIPVLVEMRFLLKCLNSIKKLDDLHSLIGILEEEFDEAAKRPNVGIAGIMGDLVTRRI